MLSRDKIAFWGFKVPLSESQVIIKANLSSGMLHSLYGDAQFGAGVFHESS